MNFSTEGTPLSIAIRGIREWLPVTSIVGLFLFQFEGDVGQHLPAVTIWHVSEASSIARDGY